MDWETVWLVLLVWCVVGLLAAIAFGRAARGNEKDNRGLPH